MYVYRTIIIISSYLTDPIEMIRMCPIVFFLLLFVVFIESPVVNIVNHKDIIVMSIKDTGFPQKPFCLSWMESTTPY